MISVVVIGSSLKRDMLDITIPLWLKQRDVNFEVVLVTDIKDFPENKKLRVIDPGIPFDFIEWSNTGFSSANGEITVIAQADMEVNSDHLLFNMQNKLEPGHMVSERFFKNGVRHSGLFCQMLMVYSSDLMKAGGFFEGYSGLCAWEDNDLMCTLMKNGVLLDMVSFDEEYASHHLWHPVNYDTPESKALQDKAKAIFESRHQRTLLLEYARQYVLRRKR